VIVGTNVLSPREQLLPAAYAQYAKNLPANAVKSWHIDSDQIYSYHIPDGELRGNKLRNGTISNAQLAANAVASNVINWANMPAGLQDGDDGETYTAGTGLDLVANEFSIADGGVGNTQLADDAVTTVKVDWDSMPFGLEDGDDVLTAGTGLAVVGGVISITNDSIGDDQLKKSYQSGSVPISIPPYASATTVPVTFSPAFDTMPIVTASLNLNPMPDDLSASVAIISQDTSGFEAKVVSSGDSFGQWTSGITVTTNTVPADARNSICEVNGRPAVAFMRTMSSSDWRLYYTRANNSAGTSWPSGARIGVHTGVYAVAMCMVNGNPAIAYLDVYSSGIYYVRATDSSGSAWSAPIQITVNARFGQPSLNIVNGNPAIAYIGKTNELRYVRASNANGSAWNTPVWVDSPTNYLMQDSLFVADGRPAVITRVKEGAGYNEPFLFLRAHDADGTAWGDYAFIGATDSPEVWVEGFSCAVIDGYPSVAYVNTDDYKIYYRRAIYPDGSAWFEEGVPVTGLFSGGYLSLAEIGGKPAVCYSDLLAGLFYSCAPNVEGTAWGAPQRIGSQDISLSSTMENINGMPMIAYGNNSTGVSFAVATATTGTLNWIAVEP